MLNKITDIMKDFFAGLVVFSAVFLFVIVFSSLSAIFSKFPLYFTLSVIAMYIVGYLARKILEGI